MRTHWCCLERRTLDSETKRNETKWSKSYTHLDRVFVVPIQSYHYLIDSGPSNDFKRNLFHWKDIEIDFRFERKWVKQNIIGKTSPNGIGNEQKLLRSISHFASCYCPINIYRDIFILTIFIVQLQSLRKFDGSHFYEQFHNYSRFVGCDEGEKIVQHKNHIENIWFFFLFSFLPNNVLSLRYNTQSHTI